jgi:hypothetical protein
MYIRGSAVNVRMYLPAPLWTPRAPSGGLLLCWCRLPQRGAIVERHSHGEGPVVFRIGSAAAAGCGELQSHPYFTTYLNFTSSSSFLLDYSHLSNHVISPICIVHSVYAHGLLCLDGSCHPSYHG